MPKEKAECLSDQTSAFLQAHRCLSPTRIAAYGDFDKREADLQTRLMHLGVQPRQVVTKTVHEYSIGSTDHELLLDIQETMYTHPHITNFMFISGDGDLWHVTRRLQLNGKNVQLIGFKEHTSNFLIQMVNEYISLDQFPQVIREVSIHYLI